ncbi:type II toxin-antitoxin system VapC family toxin [soil metagenome]
MTLFVDTAVFMYAAGSEHPFREGCRDVLRKAQDGSLQAVTSAEVIQEILHRFTGTPRHNDGVLLARSTLSLFRPVLSVDHHVMTRSCELAERHPTARARDLVHVATCLLHDLTAIISPDRDFDRIAEVRRIDPTG